MSTEVNIFKGDSIVIDFHIVDEDDEDFDLTDYEDITFMVKSSMDDADEDALITKHKTYSDYRYLYYTTGTEAFTTIGQTITGSISGATGILVAADDDDNQPTAKGILTLENVVEGPGGTFYEGDILTGSEEGSATMIGYLGVSYVNYNEINTFTVGQIVTGTTSGAKRKIGAIYDRGFSTGTLILRLETTPTAADYYLYKVGEQITDPIGGEGTVTGTAPNDFTVDVEDLKRGEFSLSLSPTDTEIDAARNWFEIQVSSTWLTKKYTVVQGYFTVHDKVIIGA